MLASVERICGYLTGGKVTRLPPLEEAQRLRFLSRFAFERTNIHQKPTFLISYSSKDEQFTKRLYEDLKAMGFDCWFAPHDLPIGAKIRTGIDDAIKTHDKVLLVLSEHAIQSAWVEKEVDTTFEREVAIGRPLLLPISLNSEVLLTTKSWAADIRRQRNIGDFSGWQDGDKYSAALDVPTQNRIGRIKHALVA